MPPPLDPTDESGPEKSGPFAGISAAVTAAVANPADAEYLRQLVADLGTPRFDARIEAVAALVRLGSVEQSLHETRAAVSGFL